MTSVSFSSILIPNVMAGPSSSRYGDDTTAEANESATVERGITRSHSIDVADGSPEISTLCHQCLAAYQELIENIRGLDLDKAEERGFNRNGKLIATQDSKSRLKAWAVNIAALQKKHHRSSLDFRLKDAAEIRQRIIRILEELAQTIANASLIVTGNKDNRTWRVGYISDSEDEEEDDISDGFPETSELDQLFSTMNATNTNLMKLSMIIRDSPTRDDYLKAASRYRFDPRYDIGHVHEKYGSAKRNKDWLVERLGKSITRRRQFLKYREEHHGKLARDWDAPEEESKPEKTIAMTKATTFVETKAVAAFERPDGSEAGESFGSQTSYDQTVMGETATSKLTVPPPPVMAFEGVPFQYGEYFQCPYCYTEQKVKNRAAWKKHVFRDLRPYVCTFKECNMRMFRSRNEWFTHELQNHRRQWVCVLCIKLFTSRTSFSAHIVSSHHVAESDPQLSALILQGEESVDSISSSACYFCNEWEEKILDPKQDAKWTFLNDNKDSNPHGTLKQFRRHLGRHMEQLALFALPMAENENLEDDDAGEESDDNDSAEGGEVDLDEPIETGLDNPFLTQLRTQSLAEIIIDRKEKHFINTLEGKFRSRDVETSPTHKLHTSELETFSSHFWQACQPLKEDFVQTSHHVIGKLSSDVLSNDDVLQLPLVKKFVSEVDLKYREIMETYRPTWESDSRYYGIPTPVVSDAVTSSKSIPLEYRPTALTAQNYPRAQSYHSNQVKYSPGPPLSMSAYYQRPPQIVPPSYQPLQNTSRITSAFGTRGMMPPPPDDDEYDSTPESTTIRMTRRPSILRAPPMSRADEDTLAMPPPAPRPGILERTTDSPTETLNSDDYVALRYEYQQSFTTVQTKTAEQISKFGSEKENALQTADTRSDKVLEITAEAELLKNNDVKDRPVTLRRLTGEEVAEREAGRIARRSGRVDFDSALSDTDTVRSERGAETATTSILNSSDTVPEALLPLYNQLLTFKLALTEVEKSGGVSTIEELTPYTNELNSIEKMRVNGKFMVGQDSAKGQDAMNRLLKDCTSAHLELSRELQKTISYEEMIKKETQEGQKADWDFRASKKAYVKGETNNERAVDEISLEGAEADEVNEKIEQSVRNPTKSALKQIIKESPVVPDQASESLTSRDNLATGYTEEQLELARQLKAEFGLKSTKQASESSTSGDNLATGYTEEPFELAPQLREEFDPKSKEAKKYKKDTIQQPLLQPSTDEEETFTDKFSLEGTNINDVGEKFEKRVQNPTESTHEKTVRHSDELGVESNFQAPEMTGKYRFSTDRNAPRGEEMGKEEKAYQQQQMMAGEEHKPFRCPVIGCEKAYRHQNGLKHHKTYGHNTHQLYDNGDGTFSIVNPETSTTYLSTLSMGGEKLYKCEACGKLYKNLHNLKYHKQESPPCNPSLGFLEAMTANPAENGSSVDQTKLSLNSPSFKQLEAKLVSSQTTPLTVPPSQMSPKPDSSSQSSKGSSRLKYQPSQGDVVLASFMAGGKHSDIARDFGNKPLASDYETEEELVGSTNIEVLETMGKSTEDRSITSQPSEETITRTSSGYNYLAGPDEDWAKITDLVEHNRIRNRIAQRDYRKKLKKRREILEKRVGSEGIGSEEQTDDTAEVNLPLNPPTTENESDIEPVLDESSKSLDEDASSEISTKLLPKETRSLTEGSQTIQTESQPRNKGKGVEEAVSSTKRSNPMEFGLKNVGAEDITDDKEDWASRFDAYGRPIRSDKMTSTIEKSDPHDVVPPEVIAAITERVRTEVMEELKQAWLAGDEPRSSP